MSASFMPELKKPQKQAATFSPTGCRPEICTAQTPVVLKQVKPLSQLSGSLILPSANLQGRGQEHFIVINGKSSLS